jgi:hypothetical protein
MSAGDARSYATPRFALLAGVVGGVVGGVGFCAGGADLPGLLPPPPHPEKLLEEFGSSFPHCRSR